MTLTPTCKKRLCVVAIVMQVVCLLPAPLAAQEVSCSDVSAEDTVVGVGTIVQAQGCVKGEDMRIDITPPRGVPFSISSTSNEEGTASAMISGSRITAAGKHVVTIGRVKTSFAVLPGKASLTKSEIRATKTGTQKDGSQVYTVTATARDDEGNAIPGLPLVLVSSNEEDSISPQSRQTNDVDGSMSWTLRTMGATVTAFDIINNVRIGSIAINAPQNNGFNLGATILDGRGGETGVVDHFEITIGNNDPVKIHTLFPVIITAEDSNGNIVQNYTGEVFIESTDPKAEFPQKGFDGQNPKRGILQFTPKNRGTLNIPLSFSFSTVGEQSITIVDRNNPAIKGTLTVQVNSSTIGDGQELVILDPPNGSYVNTTTINVQGQGPSLLKLELITGGEKKFDGETDADGVFRFTNVSLDDTKTNFTFMVQSKKSKQYQSAPITITLDTKPPTIESASLSPEAGVTMQSSTLTVKAEEKLASVTAEVEGKKTSLTESSAGIYTGTIPGVSEAGTYDVRITATDRATNETQLLMKWQVKPAAVPRVTGVTTENKLQDIILRWKGIEGDKISHYSIYITEGKDDQNIIHSLKAAFPATSATIKGLSAGKEYGFFMTAVRQDGTESEEKSALVTATPLGLTAKVIPQNGSLLIEVHAPAQLPLSRYKVAFGTEPGVFRTSLSFPAAQTISLPDLVNGTQYFVQITAVDIAGNTLTDLTTVVSGIPSGNGFIAAAPDPIPSDMNGISQRNDPPKTPSWHSGAPLIPETGVPTMILISVLIASVMGMMWWRRRQSMLSLEREFMAMMNKRYRQ